MPIKYTGDSCQRVTILQMSKMYKERKIHMDEWYKCCRKIKHKYFKSGNLVRGIEHFLVVFPSILLMARLMRDCHLGSNSISLILLSTGICNIWFAKKMKYSIPIFFGPSFAFIGYTAFIMESEQAIGELEIFWGRLLIAAFFFIFVGVFLYAEKYIRLALPDALVGPLISLVGIDLLDVAIKDAAYKEERFDLESLCLALFTLAVIIMSALIKHKLIRNASILIGVAIGSLSALLFTDQVTLSYGESRGVACPEFSYPRNIFQFGSVEWGKIIIALLPAVVVIFSENITKVTLLEEMFRQNNDDKKDVLKDLYQKSAIGQAVVCIFSWLLNSVPMAVYSENIAALSIHNIEDYEKKEIKPEPETQIEKYYNKMSAYPHRIAGIIAVVCSFLTIFRNVLTAIPSSVYGGMELFIFGLITAQGVMLVVNRRVNYKKISNQLITAATLMAGLSNAKISIYNTEITGLSLALLVGLIFNFLVIFLRYMGWINEKLDFMEVCEICIPLLEKQGGKIVKVKDRKEVQLEGIQLERFQEYIDGKGRTEGQIDLMTNISQLEILMDSTSIKFEKKEYEKIFLHISPHTDEEHREIVNDLSASSWDIEKDNTLSVVIDERISIRDLHRICKYQLAHK